MGGPGTAKTSIINQFLGSFPTEDFTAKTITFSSLTTPAIFQTAVEVGSQLCINPKPKTYIPLIKGHADAASLPVHEARAWRRSASHLTLPLDML